jgi:branched-chain amino acid transport system ATP-binding protein
MPTWGSPVLEVEALHVRYGTVAAVREVTIRVGQGEIVTILGRNGAGKTSLLNAVAGLVPRSGSVRFDGHDVVRWPAHRIARAGLVLVPERRRLFPGLSVQDNLRLGLWSDRSDRAWGTRTALVFDLFPVLQQRLDQRAGSLSGGEQQMLTIARALLTAPRMLCADEPSLGLAPKAMDAVFDALQQLNREQGLTVLLSEQRANTTLDLAHRAYEMTRGSARPVSEGHDFRSTYLGGRRELFLRPEPVRPRLEVLR